MGSLLFQIGPEFVKHFHWLWFCKKVLTNANILLCNLFTLTFDVRKVGMKFRLLFKSSIHTKARNTFYDLPEVASARVCLLFIRQNFPFCFLRAVLTWLVMCAYHSKIWNQAFRRVSITEHKSQLFHSRKKWKLAVFCNLMSAPPFILHKARLPLRLCALVTSHSSRREALVEPPFFRKLQLWRN